MKKEKIKKNCLICNKEFLIFPANKNQKFCSQKCNGKYHSKENNSAWKEKIKKICLNCNKEFEVHPFLETQKFCSQKCHYKYQSGRNNPRWKGGKIKKNCQVCNKEFEFYSNHRNRKFCSKECYNNYYSKTYNGKNNHKWKEKIIKTCEFCGKEFKVHQCNEYKSKFCSKECSGKHRIGNKNSNWNGGSSFDPYCPLFNEKLKEEIRNRDNRTCQNCGKTENENGRKLTIHHVHYDKENCYPDLIALCSSCNGKANGNRDYWEDYYMKILEKRRFLNYFELK